MRSRRCYRVLLHNICLTRAGCAGLIPSCEQFELSHNSVDHGSRPGSFFRLLGRWFQNLAIRLQRIVNGSRAGIQLLTHSLASVSPTERTDEAMIDSRFASLPLLSLCPAKAKKAANVRTCIKT